MTEIRPATADDAKAIAAIYAHHVRHGTASFDVEPPSAAFWREKIASVQARGWPFIVAVSGEGLLGYSYATQFRDRAAYQFTCENSIYVGADRTGQGIGRALLRELIRSARESGFRQMVAVIGGAEPSSVALHRASGFVEAGRLKSVGFKFGEWLDSLYMQLDLTSD